MNALKPVLALVDRIDRYQRRHRPLALVWAVQKKYSDDRAGNLCALVAYYGFLSLFPLLLLFVTIAAYVLAQHPLEENKLVHSALGQFPVIGPSLSAHRLHGSAIGLVVGAVGLLWGAQGISQTLQFAMFEVWNVPTRTRPGYLQQLARSIALFAFVGVGVVATTWVSSLGSVLDWGPAGSVLAALPAAIGNVALFEVAFKILSPKDAGWLNLLPGAAMGGIGWQVLQTVGVNLVQHQMQHASEMYGTIGGVIGILSFFYLAARITLYGAEFNVVVHRRLWPRSIHPPPLMDADKRELEEIARREERREGEQIQVDF